MARAAQRVYLEDPEQTDAATLELGGSYDKAARAALRRLVATVALVVFISALCWVAHYDLSARQSLRQHELTQELTRLTHENARMQLKLEALTSDGVVTARVKAQGYDYPDVQHAHIERIAELPWEAEVRAAKAAAEKPSVIAKLRDALDGTVRRLAQGTETSATLRLP